MTRLFLIIIIATQLSGCVALLETTAGTFIGTLGAEVVKSKLKEMKDGDEKERVHKSQD